jgi:mono/diheme cytochrome c family protein
MRYPARESHLSQVLARCCLLFGLSTALLSCARSPRTPALSAEEIRAGQEIYVFEGCGACHGAGRKGTATGPSLERLRRHWSADELARFLADPRAYPKDRRLEELSGRFPTQMAGLPAASDERLRTLALFLLAP